MIRFVQQAGRWVFLRLDRALNAAFGDRLNPLYHLGAIAYLMMWVVTATGLYLYVFFDTGVQAAYASVESISHGQWYLGQVVRGLHRYGSDAMVLAMGLHLLRHFLFDRYRGFRWFSWVSGVAMLWLVYASGINGFMLPWDRLAQYVTVASAELVDALPIVAEPMARNFLRAGSVNDRLFTLLVFMHIGIPLFSLLVLWIHTQRVPRAETAPPRALTLPLLAGLVLLSLVKPVASQGPANLDAVVTQVALDWFYLPAFPLIYAWSPKAVWLLLGGVTLLLAALPWLPPRRLGKGAEYRMTVRPGDAVATVRHGETLLEAGLRAGLPLPFECRSGGCGVCACTVLQGEVDHGPHQAGALTEEERRAGKALMCSATPLSDLDVECATVVATTDLPVRRFQARVERLEPLAGDVMRLTLKPLVDDDSRDGGRSGPSWPLGGAAPSLEGGGRSAPGAEAGPIRFHAGQYLNIVLEDRERRAFSFATAPHASEFIELHVKQVPGGAFTTWVFNAMKPGDLLTCEGPFGQFYLREDTDRPIVFVAGSTGFAPVKSMVEHAFRVGLRRPMHLYWGVKSLKDMYLRELPERWAREHDNFTFVPVLSEPAPEDRWRGRTGNVHEAILQDFPDLVNCEVYACGSVGLVQAAHDAFRRQGVPEDRCFSDAFEFAPHIRSRPAN